MNLIEREAQAQRALELFKKIADEMLNEEALSYEVKLLQGDKDMIGIATTVGGYDSRWAVTVDEILEPYDGGHMIKFSIFRMVHDLGEVVFLKPGAINWQ